MLNARAKDIFVSGDVVGRIDLRLTQYLTYFDPEFPPFSSLYYS